MASVIPLKLRQTVEKQTGFSIVGERARGGGGASRQGAEVTLAKPDGGEIQCYLAWDGRAGDSKRIPFFKRETAILTALSGPLSDSGVRAAPILASDLDHLALLSEFVPGDDRFGSASDPAALANDFVTQLAAIHKIDASHPSLAVFGDTSIPTSTRIAEQLAGLKEMNLATAPDAILQLTMSWLADNIPADDGPSVVLHGDAGPGNFLHQDNKVSTMLDWELSHLGDPAEDIAQIWVRSLIQPFIPMRDLLGTYEKASGRKIELSRIKYHRLYFQIGFTTGSHAAIYGPDAKASGWTGTSLMFSTMHRRVMVQSLAEMMGADLTDPELPDCPASPMDLAFESTLTDIKDEVVPGIDDQRVSAKVKAMARLIKYWRMRERYGAACDQAEIAEVSKLLGSSFDGVMQGREALGRAVANGQIDKMEALQLCHNRMVRETFLASGTLGALASTYYEEVN